MSQSLALSSVSGFEKSGGTPRYPRPEAFLATMPFYHGCNATRPDCDFNTAFRFFGELV
jgi:hypothetical protein